MDMSNTNKEIILNYKENNIDIFYEIKENKIKKLYSKLTDKFILAFEISENKFDKNSLKKLMLYCCKILNFYSTLHDDTYCSDLYKPFEIFMDKKYNLGATINLIIGRILIEEKRLESLRSFPLSKVLPVEVCLKIISYSENNLLKIYHDRVLNKVSEIVINI